MALGPSLIPSLLAAVRPIREVRANALGPLALTDLCRGPNLRWRQRVLDPVFTIHVVLLQMLHGNTACAHLPRLTGRPFTASAYGHARLPLAVLELPK